MKRKTTWGVLAVVMALMLIFGVMSLAGAVNGEIAVSNALSLTGIASAEPIIPNMILKWISVGTEGAEPGFAGEAATVVWYVDKPYAMAIEATNDTTGEITDVYFKIVGWNPEDLALEYDYEDKGYLPLVEENNKLYLVVSGETSYQVGWFDGEICYFGNLTGGGDSSYTSEEVKNFNFRVTPQVTVDPINLNIVLVTGVTLPEL